MTELPRTAAPTTDTNCYDKPVWTLSSLADTLPGMPRHLARVAPTVIGRPIDNRLREMIMLAVATENRCWYCQTAHAAFGGASGLDEQQVEALLSGDDSATTAAERVALAYVRDLAQRGFQSQDEQLRDALQTHFDPAACDAIESSAHVMNFANRFGNTFDAARARVAGGCDQSGASPLDLLVVSAIFAPAAACVAPVVGLLRLRKLVQRRSATKRNGER